MSIVIAVLMVFIINPDGTESIKVKVLGEMPESVCASSAIDFNKNMKKLNKKDLAFCTKKSDVRLI